jgi:hypothetical protein
MAVNDTPMGLLLSVFLGREIVMRTISATLALALFTVSSVQLAHSNTIQCSAQFADGMIIKAPPAQLADGMIIKAPNAQLADGMIIKAPNAQLADGMIIKAPNAQLADGMIIKAPNAQLA